MDRHTTNSINGILKPRGYQVIKGSYPSGKGYRDGFALYCGSTFIMGRPSLAALTVAMVDDPGIPLSGDDLDDA